MTIISRNALLATIGAIAVTLPTSAWADGTPECNIGAGVNSTECGINTLADADLSIAIGDSAIATSVRGIAIGQASRASGLHGTAVGPFAEASGMGSSALGNGALASQMGATALGVLTEATGQFSTAVGRQAVASGISSTAIGANSSATHDGSTAVGTGAVTMAANQLVLGGPGSHVRVGDIAASTAAQQASSVGIATVDANGVLGRNTAILPALSNLQADSDVLFDLVDRARHNIREANEGVAMAMAMDSPNVPAGASVALSGGVGYFKNRVAFAAAISAAVGEMSSVSAGVGYGVNSKEIGARAGFQLAW